MSNLAMEGEGKAFEDQDVNGNNEGRSVPGGRVGSGGDSPFHSIPLHTEEKVGTPVKSGTNGELVESITENGSGDYASPGAKVPRGINVGVGNTPPGGLAIPPRLVKPVGAAMSPSKTFARIEAERDDMSAMTPTPKEHHLRSKSFSLPYLGEVTLETLQGWAKEWLRNPKNVALLLWLIGVIVSGAILFMVMVGMLNKVLPKKADRDLWFEVSNQVINALFVLMALYVHPTRILHLVWLIRWNPEDILKLRSVYCKKGMRKPHEWKHMLVVVLLLQLNCIATYALAGLNWGYRRADRPFYAVAICLVVALGAGCAAGIYNSVSPLGKDFVPEADEDDLSSAATSMAERGEVKAPPTLLHLPKKYRLLERRMTFASREGKVVDDPEWQGGLCSCFETPKITAVSTCCFSCVLGYNLERLGFGNRYVHIFTFLLLIFAPFLVLDLAAINIDNSTIRLSLGGSGIVLCVFGLLYGGYWRIRMRKRYHLPASTWCCGQPNMTDCTQWFFCSLCSLCQEVRTAEAFHVIDDKFYHKEHPMPHSPGYDGKSPAPDVLLNPVPASQMQPNLESDVGKINQSEPTQRTTLTPPPTQSVEP
ncbi:hypothetical protein M758_4G181600 [Ceratodon purpureus]|uniref:PLAC8 family protein n=1 Tax=Ceratodon purpureus TaxID=3225 RepID=A0A8T0IC67_CERPU|nr:hypothetical protein KC19_4G179200 [Ceratodon purpureus]KAG0620007.1 hypothetical protein M758_4G181600 [Ceratodon purpureus]